MSDESNKAIPNIIDNYIQNERSIVNQLYFKAHHGTTIGSFREEIWREMFQQIIPKKFVIEQSVFVIDAKGAVSNEVDLAIFDETYTPYIFRYGRLKFLPIEAVAAVIECKSSSLEEETLKKWGQSIINLETSCLSYVRMANKIAKGEDIVSGTTQTATRPIRILCKLNETIKNYEVRSGVPLFDIEITASEKAEQLKIIYSQGKEFLKDWYMQLNHVNLTNDKEEKICKGDTLGSISLEDYRVKKDGKEVSLLSFNLQLNQLLMLINNPILFPHLAYAKMFNVDKTGGQEA